MLSRATLTTTALARPSHRHLSSSNSSLCPPLSISSFSVLSRRISQTSQGRGSLPDREPPIPKKSASSNESPTLPTLSLKDLTASRSAYYIVLLAFSILATLETIFYGKLIYAWYFGPDTQDQDRNE